LDLIVDTQPITPTAIAALLATRELDELICDRCQDPEESIIAAMRIDAIDQTFALCAKCTRELPRGYQEV
jgi:hypothetical protein